MLGEIDRWGIDIFRIGDLSNNRPLTAVAYAAFQVTEQFKYQNCLEIEMNQICKQCVTFVSVVKCAQISFFFRVEIC
jgi:hypothetical protein